MLSPDFNETASDHASVGTEKRRVRPVLLSRDSRADYFEQRSARMMRIFDREDRGVRSGRDELGALIGELVVELRCAETSKSEMQRELAQLRRTYDDLFDHLPLACLVTDESALVRSVNRAAALMFNASTRQILDRPVSLFFKNRMQIAELLRALAGSQATGQLAVEVAPLNHRSRHATAIVRRVADPSPAMWRWFLIPDATERGA